jgi:predicted nucleic acid-binding protein
MPTRHDRIPVTKDPELAAALERVASLVPAGAKPATLVHDLAVRGADALLAERRDDAEALEALIARSTGEDPGYDRDLLARHARAALQHPQRDEFRAVEADQALLRDVQVTVSVQRAAIGALRALAEIAPRHHRVALADALIAAAAQEAGLGVLHYDHHYDRLAEVLSFRSCWAAPPGTL